MNDNKTNGLYWLRHKETGKWEPGYVSWQKDGSALIQVVAEKSWYDLRTYSVGNPLTGCPGTDSWH